MANDKKASERKTGVAAWNESVGIDSRSSANARGRNRSAAERRNRKVALAALLCVCVAALVCAWPVKERITRGLWLKGGVAYTMKAAGEDGSTPSAEAMGQAVSTIQGRLAATGIAEYAVSQTGEDTLAIDLPTTIDDGEGVARLVGGAGLVEFARLDEIGDADALVKINAGTEDVELEKGTYTSFMDGSAIREAGVMDDGAGGHAVRIAFDEAGAQTFADVTRELAEDMGRIAIVIDGRVNSAPSVSQEIDGGEVYISGDFSREEASALKAALDGDVIPLTLSYQGSSKVGPLVGKPVLWGMVGVACVGLVGATVAAYRRFRKLAIVVTGALVVYAVLMLGLMALASRLDMFVLTMAGVAGGACAAAMTLVCAWLVVDRFRSKVVEGRHIRGAAMSAPREGLRPVAYPCAAAMTIALVFLFLPMATLRDFGLAIVFGFICGICALYWYAIPLLRLLAADAIAKDRAAWGVAADPTTAATQEPTT